MMIYLKTNNELYLATSQFKYYDSDKPGEFIFKVIQPLFGTYDAEKKIFTNFNSKQYYEIIDKQIIDTDKRIGFYNLTKLSDLQKEFATEDLEKIVTKYFDKYKDLGYYYSGIVLSAFNYAEFKKIIDSKK